MIKNASIMRRLAALPLAAVAALAQASGDSGTGGVAEMNISGGQFMLLLAAVAGVGVALWLVVKIMNR